MGIVKSSEQVFLALKGTPMLLTLLLLNLAMLSMVTYLTVGAANLRASERGELVTALRGCIQRCEPGICRPGTP